MGNSEARFRAKVEEVTRSTLGDRAQSEWANTDDFSSIESMRSAIKRCGLESCNLIVGIDFTRSNLSQGAQTFHGESLHRLNSPHGPNPYELAIGMIGEALHTFDEDNLVPAYIFGDQQTRHHSVRQIGDKGGCEGKDGVLAAYQEAVRGASFSGPTSFAPLIDEAVAVVRRSGNQMHVLLIVADGQVSSELGCDVATRDAILAAADVPLSIVMVGLGDGPWEDMEKFDDGLPERKFDNFQFVPFARFYELLTSAAGQSTSCSNIARAAFCVCALQELPAQYIACARLGLLGKREEEGTLSEEPPAKRARAS